MKRAIMQIMFFAIMLILITGCGSALKESFTLDSINSYTEIPGVTEEEIAAIEALKKDNVSFSYGHFTSTEAFELDDGTYSGFTIRLCKMLTDMFGIEFIHEPYRDWEYLVNRFDFREIDFTGDLTQTPERLQFYYMSHSIAERSLGLFTNINSVEIINETDINGLKIGVLTDTITDDYIRNAYPLLSFKTINIDSADIVAEKLKTGEIDAFVTDSVADSSFIEYNYIRSKEFFPLVYTPVSLSTANPDLEPIISVVNKYIAAGGIDKLIQLYIECDYEYSKYRLNKSFTDEEKAYIDKLAANGGSVSIAFESDNYPYSFYNETEKEFQGIAIDVLAEISELVNIRFEGVNTPDVPWAEFFQQLKAGEISMVTQLLYSDERKDYFIWPDIPYAHSYYALLSKAAYPDLKVYQVKWVKVGVVTASAYVDIYKDWFSDVENLLAYDSQSAAFDALEGGEIDLLMASEDVLLNQTHYREKSGFKVNISFSSKMDSFFGFNKNEVVLRSIISKAQSYINMSSIENNWTSRVFDYSSKLANERLFYLTGFIFIQFFAMLMMLFLFQRYKKAEREARVASKAKSAFLAHMSHEIRTPLNAIIGMSAIAKKSISDKEKALVSINQIITSSQHLLSILNDVLDMAKIESGKLELLNEPFSFLASCEDVLGIITQRCMEKDIQFITNIDDMRDFILVGDKIRVNQVLINLLANAAKFTASGGKITFSVNVLKEDNESIYLEYSVSDNGIGMSEEHIAKLFTPFEQANSFIAVKFGGTGLGLSISQNLVRMMGGDIKVQSELNVGSTFIVDLSLKKGNMKTEASSETEDFVDLKGKRILVVEDIEINRVILCEILSETEVLIDEAEDGQIALDMFNSKPNWYYDLIFMDVQMPGIDGYEATRQIRAQKREDAKSIPIIAMTANAYKEDIDQALSAGMNAHVAKPIDVDILMKTLQEYAGIKKGQYESEIFSLKK